MRSGREQGKYRIDSLERISFEVNLRALTALFPTPDAE